MTKVAELTTARNYLKKKWQCFSLVQSIQLFPRAKINTKPLLEIKHFKLNLILESALSLSLLDSSLG